MAHHDFLTGLPNRRLFYQRLRQCLLMAERNKCGVAVMFLDLDNFKEVNDRFGHDSGDAVLVNFAQILRGCLRESDIICRWAGDEFVVVLPEVKHETDVTLVAENICRTVERQLHRNSQGCRVTVSIGVAQAPQHGRDAEQLVRVADVAMYQAKQAGRNRFYIYPVSSPLPDISS
jgi:diguanylate cyclase (GGDEF)-like protein